MRRDWTPSSRRDSRATSALPRRRGARKIGVEASAISHVRQQVLRLLVQQIHSVVAPRIAAKAPAGAEVASIAATEARAAETSVVEIAVAEAVEVFEVDGAEK